MENLVFYYPQGHQFHYKAGHPERPQRVEAIVDAMQSAGWWQKYPHLETKEVPGEVLLNVHSQTYLDILQKVCSRGEYYDSDTYTTPASWSLTHETAGGAIAVCSAVWQGLAQRGFALTRPPGHHAKRNAAMGFCLLNNIAIAAEYLIQQAGCQRIAIVDLDLHHGNGTEQIFYQRRDVFYLSTHQSPFYPGSGDVFDTGEGDGKGFNFNLPLPPFSGDNAFHTAMDTLIIPLLDRFQPEIILVSYGFDTHWRDPLGYLQLSAGVYGELIANLAAWSDQHCQGRMVLCLEGGYDLEAAKSCSQAVVAAMLNEAWHDPLGACPKPEGYDWQAVIEQARGIWHIG